MAYTEEEMKQMGQFALDNWDHLVTKIKVGMLCSHFKIDGDECRRRIEIITKEGKYNDS